MEALIANENSVRLGVFLGLLVALAVVEALFPRRGRSFGRAPRWTGNLLLIAIGSVATSLLIPLAAMGTALVATEHGWGLLNLLSLPFWLQVLLAIILLDLAIYGQHVASHHIPLLWRFHKVHHADRDIDVTTGLRFHPLEIMFSMLFKMLVVLILGAPVLAVLLFELLLNAFPMFNHSNLKLPKRIDQMIRFVAVTPDMHRVHHSVLPHETNSNYGFSLSCWDRLFGTYVDQPAGGHEGMTIGLQEYQSAKPASLLWMLGVSFQTDRAERES